MPVAHRHEEGLNLLGCQRVRLLLGEGDVVSGIEPLHFEDGVLLQPQLIDLCDAPHVAPFLRDTPAGGHTRP